MSMKPCLTADMRFDARQVEALLAIVEEGSFDAAARRLHLTPSAISQRIRALEGAAGSVLVRRTAPARATEAAMPLVRLGRHLRLLAAEAEAALGLDGAVDLPIAVNADSLATWFRPVFAAVATLPGVALQLHVEDQARSHGLLRRGEVLAAVTDEPEPVQGCSVVRLREQRYSPLATPALVAAHRHGTGVAWDAMPVVVFNEADRLQDRALEQQASQRPRVVHRVPTSADFLAAVRAGLGWGMLPDEQAAPAVAAGALVSVPGGRHLDVTLYWQRWRLQSDSLEAVTREVRRAAIGTDV